MSEHTSGVRRRADSLCDPGGHVFVAAPWLSAAFHVPSKQTIKRLLMPPP